MRAEIGLTENRRWTHSWAWLTKVMELCPESVCLLCAAREKDKATEAVTELVEAFKSPYLLDWSPATTPTRSNGEQQQVMNFSTPLHHQAGSNGEKLSGVFQPDGDNTPRRRTSGFTSLNLGWKFEPIQDNAVDVLKTFIASLKYLRDEALKTTRARISMGCFHMH